MLHRAAVALVLPVCAIWFADAQTAENPHGVFEGYTKGGLGEGSIAEAAYSDGVYTIVQEGPNLSNGGFSARIEGPFTLRATVETEDLDTPKTMGVAELGVASGMDFTPNTLFFLFGTFADGSIEVSYKTSTGMSFMGYGMNRRVPPEDHTGELELTRTGDTVEAFYTDRSTGGKTLLKRQTIRLGDPVTVALTVSSQQGGKRTRGTFSNVVFVREGETRAGDWELHE